jgi:hypothetical protein
VSVASYKPVVNLGDGGVNMNQLLKGIDFDLTAQGNPSACGVYHNGAQGATVTDVDVVAGNDTFACFCGMNGAGGMHSNVRGVGARYGIYVDHAQPVPSAAGLTLSGQSISAVVFLSQETMSLVGVSIILPSYATGPAITAKLGLSLVDVSITCDGVNQTAISAKSTVYGRDLYFKGCGTAITQSGASGLAGPTLSNQWLHVSLYAKGGPTSDPGYNTDVVYAGGVRRPGGVVVESDTSTSPLPDDLLSKHVWKENSFPDMGAPGVADARKDCGAKGDGVTDDTVALQSCLSGHGSVFLPPGLFRISATLHINAGGSLVGMNNAASVLVAASAGFPAASSSQPQPMLQTSDDVGANSKPTVIAFVGVVTWQHLANVYTLDWRTQHPMSLWRTNFESRNCECLWLSAYQQLSPTIVPCSLPVNITTPKSVFRGLGRIHSFVNDDTGAILSTGAKFRSFLVANTSGFATSDNRLRVYSLNLEHAQTEANGEVRNSSFVDIYSIKGEGNTPLLWLRSGKGSSHNVSVLGFGGDPTAFPFNFTQPPDFEQLSASMFRVDPDVAGVTLAVLLDHGFGTSTYWPPKGGGCKWGHHYPCVCPSPFALAAAFAFALESLGYHTSDLMDLICPQDTQLFVHSDVCECSHCYIARTLMKHMLVNSVRRVRFVTCAPYLCIFFA